MLVIILIIMITIQSKKIKINLLYIKYNLLPNRNTH